MKPSTGEPDHVYVDSDDLLARCASAWASEKVVALDTEFVRTTTFYPILGLVQVGTSQGNYLIDPLAVSDHGPLRELLCDTGIVKALHACSEDLEVLQHALGLVPTPIFDTQVAAGILGQSFAIGYKDLVKETIGIDLPKSETRSDWVSRPLTDAQCRYAVLDVHYLLAVYVRQVQALEAKGRLSWVLEDCGRIPTGRDEGIESYYARIGSAWRLDRRQLMVLKALSTWREREARQRDVPRGRIVPDRGLMDIANGRVAKLADLMAADLVTPRQARKYGEQLLAMARDARQIPESECPELLDRPLPPKTASVYRRLKELVTRRAAELEIAPEILARKKQLEALLRSGSDGGEYSLPAELSGWRKEIIGGDLLAMVGG